MSLSKAIAQLHDAIGREGLNEGTVRSQLTVLKQEAEALEADLKRSELNLKECRAELKRTRSDLEGLKADSEEEKLPSEPDSLYEGERQLVMLIARSGGTAWISEIEAQDHAAKLEGKGFVERGSQMFRRGKTYLVVSLTDKGTTYAAKQKRK